MANFGNNSTSYGWGNALVDLIGVGVSAYSAHKQEKAQEKTASIRTKALLDAQNASDLAMQEASDAALKRQEQAQQHNQELAAPVGESATIDFSSKQNDTTGSSLDFLVPKVGTSQLSVGKRTSGLGA